MTQSAAVLSSQEGFVATDLVVVAFDKVSLAFDDNMVLRDISFSVEGGG